jgi:putative ABC transport system substrate-binding protein
LRKRDGSRVNSATETVPYLREHLQKPRIAYWEAPVRRGALCGFCIDMAALTIQTGKLAARVLQGEQIQSVKAEYPQKVSIVLNRKAATDMDIVFSLDVLNLANVIYDDYEGKQVIRK